MHTVQALITCLQLHSSILVHFIIYSGCTGLCHTEQTRSIAIAHYNIAHKYSTVHLVLYVHTPQYTCVVYVHTCMFYGIIIILSYITYSHSYTFMEQLGIDIA